MFPSSSIIINLLQAAPGSAAAWRIAHASPLLPHGAVLHADGVPSAVPPRRRRVLRLGHQHETGGLHDRTKFSQLWLPPIAALHGSRFSVGSIGIRGSLPTSLLWESASEASEKAPGWLLIGRRRHSDLLGARMSRRPQVRSLLCSCQS